MVKTRNDDLDFDGPQMDELFNEMDNHKGSSNNDPLGWSSSFSDRNIDSNMIKAQMETQELLERLEHFYRGDFQKPNEKGKLIWVPQKDKELVTLNDFGVSSMMEIVSKYLDKNTVLSYYTEERIYEVLADLGDDLVTFMFCNYEKMGMDTRFKRSKFRILITSTLHIIESAYRRAIRGQTFENLNQSKLGESQRGGVPIANTSKARFGTWAKRIFGFS